MKIRHPGYDRYPRGPAGDDRVEVEASDRAFTADGSDYWSALSTRADFGCVLWEPTDE